MGEHGQSLIPTSAQGCTDVSISTPLPATAQETLVFSLEISTYHPLVSPVLDSFPFLICLICLCSEQTLNP